MLFVLALCFRVVTSPLNFRVARVLELSQLTAVN